jgi:hypothetical protein
VRLYRGVLILAGPSPGAAVTPALGQSLPKWVVRATSAFPSIATELRTSPASEKPAHFRTHAPQQRVRYSITSSARASRFCGTFRPSALAVLRLTTSSYFVGNCAGKSAGFAPLRTRSTYDAPSRHISI